MRGRFVHDWKHLVWQIKGTLLIQVIIISVGIWSSNLPDSRQTRWLERLGFDYHLLVSGHFWHLLTGTWFQSSPGIDFSMIALVFAGTVLLELFTSTKAMLLTVITGDWVATVSTALTTRAIVRLGDANASILSISDAGSSALAHAGYGAAIMLLPRRLLPVAVGAMTVLTVAQLFFIDPVPAIAHCWATLYGALVGWYILRPRFGAVDWI